MKHTIPDVGSWMKNDDPSQISTEFYLEILNDRASLIDIIRKRELLVKIIKQALIQLDPHQLGMAVTFSQCMPPGRKGKIRRPREPTGQGRAPPEADLENISTFLATNFRAADAV